MNKTKFGRFLFATAGVFALATAAHAQEAEEVVVTGSRTIKNGDLSPSPVTVVQTQDILQVRPGNLADALNVLPVFAGSRGSTSNPSSTGSQTGGNGNANQLNLRNLGPTRTLVLLDGYRLAPTSFNNVVDADIIPQMLVQRVDTVTGGVSAVYGSDAVAGVVNYVIDRKFNGLRAQANAGVSQEGDNEKYDIGIAVGRSLSDRFHVEGSYQYLEQKGILARSDRDWLTQWGVAGGGTTANPYQLFNNVRQAAAPFGGLISNGGPLNNMTFGTDGVLRAFVPGTLTGTAALQIGGDGGYFDSTLLAPAKGHQAFGRADFDVTENLRAYVQLSANIKTNESFSDPLRITNSTFSATNAFLAPAYQTQLAGAGLTTFRLSKLFGNDTRLDSVADSKQYVARAGLDGSIGDYEWGVAYSRSTAKLNTALANNVNNTNLARALDAVSSGGQTVCNITVTNPTLGAGCVPLNPFGPTAHSAAALAYVLTPTYYEAKTTMDDFGGHVEGSPFSTWAGPVNMSVSGEWRKLSFEATSTGTPQDTVNCTNIRFNCTANAAQWAFSFANAPQVSQTVKEAAIEADVPLIKDKPLIQSLSINGAARYTDYDTSGEYTTWKIGGDWHVNDQLRFRATKSRDIRAPTLYELFAPINSVPINPVDLLTGLNPQVPSTDLSNSNLTAEEADTTTGGVVFRPFSALSITLDGYKIVINGAITQAAGSSPAYQQLCYASGGTSQWCELQVRPLNYTNTSAANAVTRWYTKYLNFAEIETSGADLEVNYNASLFNHPASVRLLTAYQPHVYYRQEGAPTLDQGGVAFGATGLAAGPAWRIAGFARVQPFDGFTVDVLQRWRSGMKLGGDPTQVWVDNHIDSFGTTNVTFTYNTKALMQHDTALVFGIENVFNAEPPGGGYSGNGTRAGLRDGFALGDDVAGRQFTVGLRMRM